MKRNILGVLTIAAAALALIGAGREGGGGGGGGRPSGGSGHPSGGGGHPSGGGGGRSSSAHASHASSPSIIYRQQRVPLPRAAMPKSENIIRDQARPVFPRSNESGGPITQRRGALPPAQHTRVARNENVVRGIHDQQRNEVMPNHYYWHNENGVRYSHYYDGHNHWYGFYHGPTFYWTRYSGNRWWWYDPLRARWDFWWDGYWWWPGAGGTPYVYVDNNYYPYEDAGVTVEHVQEQPAPASMPETGSGKTTDSPDGRRMVQLDADGQAYLYDKSQTPPAFLKYLGQGVSQVRFSGGTAGAPLQVMVEYKDNTFALFDADGNSQSSAVQTEESTTPAAPDTPDSIPPPPTAAPGQ